MNSDYKNQKTLSNTDSVFNSRPKEYFNETAKEANILRRNISIVTILVYNLTVVCTIWFIWIPARNQYGGNTFYHSPTFFFLIIWITITYVTVLLSGYSMKQTAKKKYKIISETEEIAEEVYLLEEKLEN